MRVENKRKNIFVSVVDFFSSLIFGRKAGMRMLTFVGSFSGSFFGGVASLSLLFLTNVLAGRWLGPEELGRYNFVMALANILSVFLVLDTDTGLTYFLSKNLSEKQKEKYVSASFFLFIFFLVSGIFLALVGFYFFSPFFAFSATSFFWVVLLSMVIAFKRMGEGVARGLKIFFGQALAKFFEGLGVLFLFLFFVLISGERSHSAYLFAVAGGGILLVFLYSALLKKNLKPGSFSGKNLKETWHYAKFGVINSLATLVFKGFDKILIFGFLGAYELGIYSVYYVISILLGARLMQLFVNVYFPSVNEVRNKEKLVGKINLLLLKTGLPIFLSYLLASRAILFFFGEKYPVHWDWLLISGVYVLSHFATNLYGWILAGMSARGYKQQNLGVLWNLSVFVSINVIAFMFGDFSITWILAAFAAGKMASVFFYARKINQKMAMC